MSGAQRRPGFRAARAAAVLGAAVALGATALTPSQAAGSEGTPALPTPPDRGVSWAGLGPGGTACPGGYRVNVDASSRRPVCTHGPDATDEVVTAAARPAGGGRKPSPSPSPTASVPPPAPAGARCGADGARVQAVLVRAADTPDRLAGLLPSVQQWIGEVDRLVMGSAAQTGAVRHVRFVTDGSCVPTVMQAVVSPAGDDSLSATMSELRAQGLNRTDRKYLIWMDANVYCGIATVLSDDTPLSANRNNTGPSYGRVDAGCWGGPTEAHELMHTLGAVQLSAPHSNGSWHCTDEYDLMCYETSGKAMSYSCPLDQDRVLDCGRDDYFSTGPAAGSYLATHWNVADSAFLTPAD